jgi:hypothetical protein
LGLPFTLELGTNVGFAEIFLICGRVFYTVFCVILFFILRPFIAVGTFEGLLQIQVDPVWRSGRVILQCDWLLAVGRIHWWDLGDVGWGVQILL